MKRWLDVAYFSALFMGFMLRGASPLLTQISFVPFVIAAIPLAIQYGKADWRSLTLISTMFLLVGILPLWLGAVDLASVAVLHAVSPWIGWAIWGRKATRQQVNRTQ